MSKEKGKNRPTDAGIRATTCTRYAQRMLATGAVKRVATISIAICTVVGGTQVSGQSAMIVTDNLPRSAQVASPQTDDVLPYRPKPGDKLGYSKEESTKRLAPEHRAFLDGILRLYHEPGLFARRSEVFAVIGAAPGTIQPLSHSAPSRSVTERFRQYAAAKGLFAKEGWSADYLYDGRKTKDGKTTWFALLTIAPPYKQECVNSRAVEGYLDFYLYQNIDGFSHPLPPRLWDRHGISGRATAKEISPQTPSITLGFVGGCLSGIYMGQSFNFEEISDEHVIN